VAKSKLTREEKEARRAAAKAALDTLPRDRSHIPESGASKRARREAFAEFMGDAGTDLMAIALLSPLALRRFQQHTNRER
jgi:hypothetical protein